MFYYFTDIRDMTH